MVTLILSHAVRDFDPWHQGFLAHEPKRQEHGIRIQALYRGLEQPNHVTVIAEMASPENFQRFMADPQVQATMQAAGVEGAPTVQLLQRVGAPALA